MEPHREPFRILGPQARDAPGGLRAECLADEAFEGRVVHAGVGRAEQRGAGTEPDDQAGRNPRDPEGAAGPVPAGGQGVDDPTFHGRADVGVERMVSRARGLALAVEANQSAADRLRRIGRR